MIESRERSIKYKYDEIYSIFIYYKFFLSKLGNLALLFSNL